jgi:O-Antigen ligase
LIRSFSFFDLPLVLFGVAVIFAAGAAHDVSSAEQTLAWLLGGIAFAILSGHVAASDRLWHATAGAAAFVGGVMAIFFITQYSYLEVDAKIPILDAVGRFASSPFPRVGVWSPFSNSVAACLEGLFLLAAGLAFDGHFQSGRGIVIGGAAVMGTALALTMSRGAWLGVTAGCAVWIVTSVSARRIRGSFGASAIVAALVFGLAMTWRPGLEAISTVAGVLGQGFVRPDRMYVYSNSLTLLQDVGLRGLGPGGQYAMPFARFALLIQVPFVTYPHQLTLHLWLAYGLCGVVAWNWWVSGLAMGIAASEHRHRSHGFRGAYAGLVAILVHGLTDARQAVDPWTWCPVFALAGLVVAHCRRSRSHLSSGTLVLPLVFALLVTAAAVWRFAPLAAAWELNEGIIDEARATFANGDSDVKATLLQEATRHYERAIEVDPLRAGARRRLALLASDRAEFTLAWEHARVALEADPASLATRKAAGLVAAWTGNVELARALLAPLPGIGDELTTWASVWEQRGELVAARNAAQLARDLRAQLPDAEERLRNPTKPPAAR